MRRALFIAWFVLLACLLTWQARRRSARTFLVTPDLGGPLMPDVPALEAPPPMLVESSRARFSRPETAGGAPGAVADVAPIAPAAETLSSPDIPDDAALLSGVVTRNAPTASMSAPAAAVAPVAGRGDAAPKNRATADAPAVFDGAARAARAAGASPSPLLDALKKMSGLGPPAGAPGVTGTPAPGGPSAATGASGAATGSAGSALPGVSAAAAGASVLPGRVTGVPVGGAAAGGASGGLSAGSGLDALAGRASGAGPGGSNVAGVPVGEEKGAAAERPQPYAAEPTPGEAQPAQTRPAPGLYSTDRGKPPIIVPGVVERQGAKGAVVFTADMDIDADGAGGWHVADKTGQSQTSLRYPNGESLNPGRLPFMVVPTDFNRTHPEVRLGDYGVISYKGKSVFVIVGDKGPAGVLGEASISAATSLGINADPNKGGVDGGVRYVIFPGTADRVPPSDAGAIQTRGAQLLQEQELPLR